MKLINFHLFLFMLLLLTACGAPPAPVEDTAAPTSPPTAAPTATETETEIPTEAPLPTETATIEVLPPTEAPTDLFGVVSNTEVQAGFMLEPVVSQIFAVEMNKLIASGEIEAYQVERLGVYPKGDGTLYAEVFYRVKTTEVFWPEDGGIEEDGWVTGKCSRFDFVITPEEYQLTNKRLCS